MGDGGHGSAASLEPIAATTALLLDEGGREGEPGPRPRVDVKIIRSPQGVVSTEATIVISHREERDFVGDVELVVWLATHERTVLWLPSVTVARGQTVELPLGPGGDWEWRDARYAWARLFAAP